MKNRVLMFIIGILIGAIIATLIIYIKEKNEVDDIEVNDGIVSNSVETKSDEFNNARSENQENKELPSDTNQVPSDGSDGNLTMPDGDLNTVPGESGENMPQMPDGNGGLQDQGGRRENGSEGQMPGGDMTNAIPENSGSQSSI